LDLVERLKEVVRSFRLTLSAPAGQSAPIWEHEAVQQYEAADARGDWAVVGNSLRIFERQMFSHLPLTQSVRCLNRCGLSHLVDASVAMRQTIAAIQVAAALHVHERLRLAGASENPYIQFGCAYETLSGRQAADRFSADEQLLMEQLLVNVAAVPDRWAGWMRAFNAIPARFRALQVPLGRAMARTPEAAGAAYVDAITLFCSPAAATRPDQHAGRRAIAECLSAFRAEASLERRIVLWTAAHHRWSAWNFDERNSNTHLFAVCWSDLDYASIGFACECMAEGDRLAAMNAIREKLRSIDLRWHESISDIISAWNRLLSQFQPYARASQLAATAGDWSSEKQVVLPFDPATSRYLMLKYRIPEMTPPVAPADQNVCGMDPKSETQLIGR